MSKDYYQDLGIDKNATTEDVKAAFRRLAMEHHPDKGGDPEKFKKANEAYQVLSDESKRAQYDRYGSVPEGAAGGFNGFNGQGFNINVDDLGDIFGGLGGIFGGMGGQTQRRRSGGRDIQIDAKVNFLDAVFGTDYEVELMKPVHCSHCKASGGEPGSKQTACSVCRGSGQVVQARNTMFGVFQTTGTCSSCHGAGKKFDRACSICHGSGVVRERKKMVVRIPAGVDDGNTIRVTGEGEAGERGSASGDLFVRIRVRRDDRFNRVDDNILSEASVSFSDAALGATVSVETVDGKVGLKIPAGTQPGTVLKLKSRGIPHLRSDGRGDHLVTVSVEVPRKLSKKQKQLLEELRDIE